MKRSDENRGCDWVRERIDRFVDEELEPGALAPFERHVEGCDPCRRELQAARRIVAELRALPRLDCPDAVVDRVFERVAVEEEAGTRRGRGLALPGWLRPPRFAIPRPAVAAALVLLIAVTSLVAVRVGRRDTRPTPEEIAQAEAAIKWTLAYVNDVSRRASITVRDDVIGERVVGPMRKAVRTTFEGNPQPSDNQGGSV